MNYYQHHIGDFRAGTFTMGRLERWLYRDMMDMYYDTEKPLPLDHEMVFYTLGTTDEHERTAVERLLKFKFQKTTEGYVHERCDSEIRAFHDKAEKASAAGKASAASRTTKKPTDVEQGGDVGSTDVQRPSTNHKPLTNNHKNKTLSAQSTDAPILTGEQGDDEGMERRKQRRSTPEDEACARWLFGRILANNPGHKPPSFDAWSDDVRLMRERDRRTHREICELFSWAQDDEFWKANVLSPAKLREKWDQLTIKRGTPQKGTKHGNFAAQDYRAGVSADGKF